MGQEHFYKEVTGRYIKMIKKLLRGIGGSSNPKFQLLRINLTLFFLMRHGRDVQKLAKMDY